MATRILILGSGIYQVPLIRRAKAMGLQVAVASNRPSDPGFLEGDERWLLDTTDAVRLLDRARASKIDAVATTGTDVAMPSAGYLSDHLGLPGPSYKVTQTCTNKIQMKESFLVNGVPTAPFEAVATLTEAKSAAFKIGLPVVFKTPDSSGSRGFSVVRSIDQIPWAFEWALVHSRCGKIIVERFLRGTVFGAEAVMQDGRLTRLFCHNTTLTGEPITVSIGHSAPARLTAAHEVEAGYVCAKALAGLGVVNGVCDADLILTDDGIKVFEVAVRAGGSGILELIHAAYGLDLYDSILAFALGRKPTLATPKTDAAAIGILRSEKSGVVSSIEVPADVRNHPHVIDWRLDYGRGDRVRAFKTGPDRIGDLSVRGPDPDAAERLLHDLSAMIDIRLIPDESADIETRRVVGG